MIRLKNTEITDGVTFNYGSFTYDYTEAAYLTHIHAECIPHGTVADLHTRDGYGHMHMYTDIYMNMYKYPF